MPKIILSEPYKGDGFVFPANVELLVSDDFVALLQRRYPDKFKLVKKAEPKEEPKVEEPKTETVVETMPEAKATETVAEAETSFKATKVKK